MKTKSLLLLSALLSLLAGPANTALAKDKDILAHGRYLAQVAGCNDCHTPGYMATNGQVPEAQWLTGDSFGWNGPWGTTYGSNLRLYVSKLSEDAWVKDAKTLTRRPPMPWFNLNAMSEYDLRALYRFMKSLGEPGAPAPAALPPGQEPPMPYMTLKAPPPPGAQAKK